MYDATTERIKSDVRRPLSVTILSIAVLILAGLQITRFFGSILQWHFLSDLYLPGVLYYLLLNGMFWGIVWLIITFGLWTAKNWATNAIRFLLLLYLANYWIEYIASAKITGTPIYNWLYYLLISAALTIWAFWCLSRPVSKQFFGEKHER